MGIDYKLGWVSQEIRINYIWVTTNTPPSNDGILCSRISRFVIDMDLCRQFNVLFHYLGLRKGKGSPQKYEPVLLMFCCWCSDNANKMSVTDKRVEFITCVLIMHCLDIPVIWWAKSLFSIPLHLHGMGPHKKLSGGLSIILRFISEANPMISLLLGLRGWRKKERVVTYSLDLYLSVCWCSKIMDCSCCFGFYGSSIVP